MSLQTHGKSDADAEHDLGEEYGETFILRAELRLGKRTCVKHDDMVSCTYLPPWYIKCYKRDWYVKVLVTMSFTRAGLVSHGATG